MKQVIWLAIFAVVLTWSAIEPKDTLTWVLEVAPAVIGLAVLAATRRRYPLPSRSVSGARKG